MSRCGDASRRTSLAQFTGFIKLHCAVTYSKVLCYLGQTRIYPKHTTRITKQFFEDNIIDVLEWATSNADLDPIEYLWGKLKTAVSEEKCKNLDGYFEKVKEHW